MSSSEGTSSVILVIATRISVASIGKTPCATSSDARRNVNDTFETLNEQVLEDVARCSSHADTTLVVAAGASHGAGSYLASSLQIIGVRTVLPTGMADAALALATLGSGDVMVGLSLWYLASTVEIVAHAKQDAGATTIVLTDSAVSSATQSADHVLVVSASTVGPRLSMTGLIALRRSSLPGLHSSTRGAAGPRPPERATSTCTVIFSVTPRRDQVRRVAGRGPSVLRRRSAVPDDEGRDDVDGGRHGPVPVEAPTDLQAQRH